MTRKTFTQLVEELYRRRDENGLTPIDKIPVNEDVKTIISFYGTINEFYKKIISLSDEKEIRTMYEQELLTLIYNFYGICPQLRKKKKYDPSKVGIEEAVKYLRRAIPRIQYNGKTYKQYSEEWSNNPFYI